MVITTVTLRDDVQILRFDNPYRKSFSNSRQNVKTLLISNSPFQDFTDADDEISSRDVTLWFKRFFFLKL